MMIKLRSFLDKLEQFIKTFKYQDKSDLERPPMRGFMVVQNSISLGDSFEKFTDILRQKGITNEITSFVISDFDHGEENVFIASVEENNGIYQLDMRAPKPIMSEYDKENNQIYCLFRNPIDCFKFVKKVIPDDCPH